MQSIPKTISLEFYNLGYRLTTLYCQMAILSMLIFGLLITKSGSCPSVPWGETLINLLISDKAQKMARDVPLINIYNTSWYTRRCRVNKVKKILNVVVVTRRHSLSPVVPCRHPLSSVTTRYHPL